ncbi:hypothetical protein QWY14_05195 [Planococcus sp. N028]|uniref:Uncharacterized protein n=1 Tax=Planococcus shixiaomingii TaxID=3058393 RepID=A0ABT8N0G6_9BACL|nr:MULTISPECIES: hypothetical protein [unclassified Planococcus (in: firmicutes)]MDN7241174.1 hypothetical protein [Planococcus sp. N028]WKA53427.1 hypothetical protein QWY21_12230 [Planococcus sp. N022]
MQKKTFKELKQLNTNSAHAMGFLVAGTLALLVIGFLQHSLPAFLLAVVFTLNLILESRAYKASLQDEEQAAKLQDLMNQLTKKPHKEQDERTS